MTEKAVVVHTRAGIHARPAVLTVQLANKFKSDISLEFNSLTADAKSIMGMLTIGAEYNATVIIRATGDDEELAVKALTQLFENKFDET